MFVYFSLYVLKLYIAFFNQNLYGLSLKLNEKLKLFQYLEFLVKIANNKMEDNFEKIDRYIGFLLNIDLII